MLAPACARQRESLASCDAQQSEIIPAGDCFSEPDLGDRGPGRPTLFRTITPIHPADVNAMVTFLMTPGGRPQA